MTTPQQVAKGDRLPESSVSITRTDLVRYAGASGDFNPIHHSESFAHEVGLPDVIAHGMLTMALATRLVTDWVGDPGRIVEHGVRFTRPVVVPDDGKGATVELSGKVADVAEDGTAKVNITAKCADQGVLGGAYAVVRL
ncbi:MaoC like domain-containing protein [Actinopolyspora xinjiangensis]|uniref:MaoC like domain-containing protein n=1 Tax=Actinopolyspora xinjiangensis TaxID=405564 RepID=A0A1H0WCH0_9ACTN|nr:MaoC family dehydratase [Actinopolyspora xinjiangensis]SDP88402.1 MaoC like domain-containing protein [Actinopolyspora xinjiangensis]